MKNKINYSSPFLPGDFFFLDFDIDDVFFVVLGLLSFIFLGFSFGFSSFFSLWAFFFFIFTSPSAVGLISYSSPPATLPSAFSGSTSSFLRIGSFFSRSSLSSSRLDFLTSSLEYTLQQHHHQT